MCECVSVRVCMCVCLSLSVCLSVSLSLSLSLSLALSEVVCTYRLRFVRIVNNVVELDKQVSLKDFNLHPKQHEAGDSGLAFLCSTTHWFLHLFIHSSLSFFYTHTHALSPLTYRNPVGLLALEQVRAAFHDPVVCRRQWSVHTQTCVNQK